METITWQDQDGVRWIELEGELDQTAHLELSEPFMQAVGESDGDVVVMLNGVTFLCSMVIGLFVKGQQELKARGHALRVKGMRPTIRTIFETLNLFELIAEEQ